MHTQSMVTGPLLAQFRKLAIPAAIGMAFSTLYNVVDVLFAGLISTQAQAGLAISFQPFFLLSTFAFGMGTALSALVGNEVGAKRPTNARKVALEGLAIATIGAVVLLSVGALFADILLSLTTDPGPTKELGQRYFYVLLFALPGFIISFAANGILQSLGDAESFKRGLIAAFFANIALDPLFVWGIPGVWDGIGFDGLALSSACTQTGVAAYLLWRIFGMNMFANPRWGELTPSYSMVRQILSQSLPSTTTMLVLVVSGFVVLGHLRGFGETAQAAYAIALRIEQIVLLPALGLTGALLPIVAQNFGAGEPDRVIRALYCCLAIGAVYLLIACPILWIGAYGAMRLFSDNADVIKIGVSYLRIDGVILPAYMVLFAINSFLQGLKKPLAAFWIGVFRQAVAVPVFIHLFLTFYAFEVSSVWLGIAAAVFSGLLFAMIVARFISTPLLVGQRHERSATLKQ